MLTLFCLHLMDIYVNNNVAPYPNIAISIKFEQTDYTFAENVGEAIVRLVRSGATAQTITITVISGRDYVNNIESNVYVFV